MSRLREFLSVYRLYRKAAHSRRYCLQAAIQTIRKAN